MSNRNRKVNPAETLPDLTHAATVLADALGPGWTLKRTAHGCRARAGLLSVSLKFHADAEEGPWRSRLRDSFPRRTIVERHGLSAEEAVHDVAKRARSSKAMIDGQFGLVTNTSKSWIAYRLWSAVRPD
jgi:hypothetical protein